MFIYTYFPETNCRPVSDGGSDSRVDPQQKGWLPLATSQKYKVRTVTLTWHLGLLPRVHVECVSWNAFQLVRSFRFRVYKVLYLYWFFFSFCNVKAKDRANRKVFIDFEMFIDFVYQTLTCIQWQTKRKYMNFDYFPSLFQIFRKISDKGKESQWRYCGGSSGRSCKEYEWVL